MKTTKTNKLYFDLWSSIYDKDPISIWLYSIQKKILNYIKIQKNSKVLDVGCGTGASLKYLETKGNKNLFGIDLSQGMVKKARQKLGPKAVLKESSVEKIQFKSNYFDYVLCTEAFHHFPKPDLALKEMKRVLKKTGKIILADVNFYFLSRPFCLLEPGCVDIYDERKFSNLFVKNRLRLIEQKRISMFVILNVIEKD